MTDKINEGYVYPPCPTHAPDQRCVMCIATYIPTLEEVQECFNEECKDNEETATGGSR